MRGYETLDVYKRAFALQRPIHDLALRFPDYEKFDLANQMRRACKSVPALIAEGYARNRSPKELCAYLAQAIGSANEMEVHLRTAGELGYLSKEESEHYRNEYDIVGKQLTNLMKYWRARDRTGAR